MKPACGPDFLGPLLGHATHLARERMDARLSRYDMTPSQTHTLLYLSSHGYTAPQRDVVEHLRVRPSTANGILDRMEEKNIELHSFMVVRHGKCAAKGWWKPYAPELAHPLYSFGKTLTATAIGFARQEKILSLEERLVDLFPELLPKEPSENLQKVTLWHLLTMSCGHETEIDMESPDWIREFLQHPFLHEPGTFYKYNTAGTNMLAAVLKRKTGCDVTEFLKPRLLEPLGITSLTLSLIHI